MLKGAIKSVNAFFFVIFILSLNHFILKAAQLWNKILRTIKSSESGQEKKIIAEFPELVAKHGYSSESHQVITDDGYVLTLHRLPGVPNLAMNNPPVLLVHGIFSSSDVWIHRGRNQDLAFMLVDEGYDVWLYNSRGNYYSRKHLKLDPDKDNQFWQFSTDEMGYFDLATTIDFVLAKTGKEKLSLIGYSMGSLLSYVLLSHKPDYNKKINLNISAGAIAFIAPSTVSYLQRFINSHFRYIKKVSDFLNVYETLPQSRALIIVSEILMQCPRLYEMFQKFLLTSARLVAIRKYKLMDLSFLDKLLHHWPHGTSSNVLYHYLDMMEQERVHHFDYGPEENLKRYGSFESPDHPLQNVTTPTIIYSGVNDGFATKEERERLVKILPNAQEKVIDDELFHHIDYLFHTKSRELWFNDVVNVLDEYNCKSD